MGRNRICQVCRHPERVKIEALRAGGVSLQSLEERFGVHKDAIWRHWNKCVSNERKGTLLIGETRLHELADLANREDKSLLEYLTLVRSILVNQLANAAEVGDRHGTSILASRLLECLERIGKLTGEIRQLGGMSITNNIAIFNSPEFVELQGGMIAIARTYPETRGDIVALLRRLDAKLKAAPAQIGAGCANA